jgi:hypothetical protein
VKRLIATSTLALLLVAGCGGSRFGETEAPDAKVVQAAATAKEIQADPGRAALILKKHNLTQVQFESLLYEIAVDPELSRAYRVALTGK